MNRKDELRSLIVVAVVAFAVFANTLGGEFVYDDSRQILRNPLIQDSKLYGKAMTSDVWAFKGDGSVAASNYYRPTFVAWLIVNFRLFSTNPFGWHLLNVLLHVLVCALCFLLLRRWDLPLQPALAASLIFAVHPVHTESVAWISGSPDLLFAASLLGALWFTDKFAMGKKSIDLAAALGLYTLALGSKESAIFCVPIIYFVIRAREDDQGEPNKVQSSASPVSTTAMFAALAVIYFLIRWAVLGKITQPVPDAPSFTDAIYSVPQVFLFYFKQMTFPIVLGENYPLRPVGDVSFVNFVVPVVLSIVIAAASWLAARRSHVRTIGALILLLPLLPVLNITTFPSDQIVHDRYLYLPLFGLLIIVFSLLHELLKKNFPERVNAALSIAAVAFAIPLAVQTYLYNRTWSSNLALWSHNAKIDPASPSTLVNYGAELSVLGRYDEAITALDRSVENRPNAGAYMARARNLMAVRRFEEAESDLLTVIAMPPESLNAYTLYQSYETLALLYTQTGSLDKADARLRESRGRLPIYSAALSEKLAVVLYQKGDKQAALAELEAAKGKARTELLPESQNVFLRLGMLYAELGRKPEARTALQEYLKSTANTADTTAQADRVQAANLLRGLK